MRIITASKFYYQRGGLESYILKISDILRSYGHEIIPFSTNYSENIDTEFSSYFAEYIDISGSEKTNLYKKFKAFSRIFYNFEAKDKISKLINHTKPDILWGFGVHRHLSPSIFAAAKEKSIPVIHRLSDYAIICPGSRLTKGDNSNCTELLCSSKGYFSAITNKCIKLSGNNDITQKSSFTASIIGAMELYFHNRFNLYVNNVSKFIAPSNFLRDVMIKSGIPEDKITYIPIFIDPYKYNPEYISQPYLVYFGRLSPEKGLDILLNAMANLKHHKLMIIGDGPHRDYLEKIKEQKNLINVKFLGKLYGEQLCRVIRNSRLVVIPSTWYENSPHVILEAFALGKPVLGANIGGIPEYINENIDGMLYQFDSVDELQEKINFLMEQQTFCEEMGRAARKKVEVKFNPKIHYSQVLRIMESIT